MNIRWKSLDERSCDYVAERADDSALRAGPQEICAIYGPNLMRAVSREVHSEKRKKRALQALQLPPEERPENLQRAVKNARGLKRLFRAVDVQSKNVLGFHPSFQDKKGDDDTKGENDSENSYFNTAFFCQCYTPNEVVRNEKLLGKFLGLQWPNFQYMKPDASDNVNAFIQYRTDMQNPNPEEKAKLQFVWANYFRSQPEMLREVWEMFGFLNEKVELEAGIHEHYEVGLLTYSEMKMQLFGLAEGKIYKAAVKDVTHNFMAVFSKYLKSDQGKIKKIFEERLQARIVDILMTHAEDKVPIEFVHNKVQQLAQIMGQLMANPYLDLDNEAALNIFDETLNKILYPGYRIHMHLGIGGSEDPVNVRMGAYLVAPLQIIKIFLEAGIKEPPLLKIVHAKALADEINQLDPLISEQVAQLTEDFCAAFVQNFFPGCREYVHFERPQHYADFTEGVFEQNVQFLQNLDGFKAFARQQANYYHLCIKEELRPYFEEGEYLFQVVMNSIHEYLKKYKLDPFGVEESGSERQRGAVTIPEKYRKHPRVLELVRRYGIPLCRILVLKKLIEKDQGRTLAKLQEKGERHGGEHGKNGAIKYIAAHVQARLFGTIHEWDGELKGKPNAVWKVGGKKEIPFTDFQELLVSYIIWMEEDARLRAQQDASTPAQTFSTFIPGAIRGSRVFHTISFLETLAGRGVCTYYSIPGDITLHQVDKDIMQIPDMAALLKHYLLTEETDSHGLLKDIRILAELKGDYVQFIRNFMAERGNRSGIAESAQKQPFPYNLVTFKGSSPQPHTHGTRQSQHPPAESSDAPRL